MCQKRCYTGNRCLSLIQKPQDDIVYRTLEKLADSLDELLHPEAMIHSDQAVHYTHPEFQRRVKKLGLM
ncbi:hypothetical protein ACPOM7_18470 [Peribacillus castrilensis]